MPLNVFKGLFGKTNYLDETPYYEAVMLAEKALKDSPANTPFQSGRFFFRKAENGSIKLEGKIH